MNQVIFERGSREHIGPMKHVRLKIVHFSDICFTLFYLIAPSEMSSWLKLDWDLFISYIRIDLGLISFQS